MLENLDTHLAAQQEPLKKALIELVRIPSVCDEGAGGYPFGEAVDQALRKALKIAGDLGFRTHYGDGGYYGYAEIGEGARNAGHPGAPGCRACREVGRTGSATPSIRLKRMACSMVVVRRMIKARCWLPLFAVKALLDAGVKFNKRVRFIFGTDEETLWRCINRYTEKEEIPDMGFSPDARFPLTFAEKGLLQLQS